MAILGLLFMLQLVSFAIGQFTCNPFADCKASVGGGLVPDPYDCEQYYVCLELVDGSLVPSTIPSQCGNGFYFDHNTKACMSEETSGECFNMCQNICSDDCATVTGVLAGYQPDCMKFLYCFMPTYYEIVDCVAPNLFFNGTACGDDPSHCCDFCNVWCENGGIQIIHPCDCTSYYVCTASGRPSEADKITCGSGYYYDNTSSSCVQGQCFNFCSTAQCDAIKE